MPISRLIGYIIYYGIAIRMPKSNAIISLGSKNVRALTAKMFCNHIGKNVNIQKGVIISNKLSIGDNSGIGINSVVQGKVEIGDNVMIGPECYIYTQNHCHLKTDIPMIKQGYEEEQSVTIGNDVWIGSRVTILPGVNIGNGVVIGASTVVPKSVPDYAIVVGNPAKIVGYRKKEECK